MKDGDDDNSDGKITSCRTFLLVASLLLLATDCFMVTSADDGSKNLVPSSEQPQRLQLHHYTQGSDGQPGCRTAEEVNRPWRNNFDPTRFWFCAELGKQAEEIRCAAGGFMASVEKCVPWCQWQWEEPVDPPTLA